MELQLRNVPGFFHVSFGVDRGFGLLNQAAESLVQVTFRHLWLPKGGQTTEATCQHEMYPRNPLMTQRLSRATLQVQDNFERGSCACLGPKISTDIVSQNSSGLKSQDLLGSRQSQTYCPQRNGKAVDPKWSRVKTSFLDHLEPKSSSKSPKLPLHIRLNT